MLLLAINASNNTRVHNPKIDMRFKLAESLNLIYNEPSLDMGMIATFKYSVEIQALLEFST